MPRAEPSRARGSETALARQAWVVALVLPCSSERVTCLHPISEGRVAGVSNRAGTSDEVMRGKSLDERAHACMHMNYATAFNQLCGEGVLPHQAEGGARACDACGSVRWVAPAVELGPFSLRAWHLAVACCGRCGTVTIAGTFIKSYRATPSLSIFSRSPRRLPCRGLVGHAVG